MVWESPLYTEHELVGKLWQSSTGEFVDPPAFWQQLDGVRYLILGEKHDNPDHHILQLQLLNDLISQRKLSRLTLEMLDSSSNEALRNLDGLFIEDIAELRDYLGWDSEGWDWEFYGPLVTTAFQSSLPLFAGNIDQATISTVYSRPTPPQIASVFDASVIKRLESDIRESHCDLLPESQIPSMVRIQQVRDHSMAEQLIVKDEDDMGLLIAGNYHARHDLGVPNYLLVLDQGLQRSEIISLSFMEVRPGEYEPENYLDQFGEQSAYNFIWFTPAVTTMDYCDSLR
ncbi:MAG: ChaN family lipoprotein [Gammaproteobacteria bacterium]|nr:ChaN family lipoprotein [Gammaproteobacteria bacterium]